MNNKGFTLVEVIVVIAIIGILVGITVPSLKTYSDKKKESERSAHETTINNALRQCFAVEGKYPSYDYASGDVTIPDLLESGGRLYDDYFVRINKSLYRYSYTSPETTVTVTLN